MQDWDGVEVLGVQVACLTVHELLQQAVSWANQREMNKTIMYVNAYCLNQASQNKAHLDALASADLVYPDGISVVWSSKLLGGCRLEKITGADWIDQFCELTVSNGLRIYILAGKPGVARRAAEALEGKYPGLLIIGACDGYFIEKTEEQAIADIQVTSPHILLVGMGTPTQELWLARHRQQLGVPVCWAVGALFDYVAGIEPRAPAIFNQLALEWLWRLFIDPRGKWKRYLVGNPVFIYRVFRQKIFSSR
jgi:N-acetylglucosaminyldiphosphoundecaprenol N-acetyl-beta-D-mannosaminyltransferase